MITASAVLVLLAAVLLVLGLTTGDGGLGLLYGSIATCLVAAVLLAVGVARQRPRRGGALAGEPTAWSGARAADGDPGDGDPGDGDPAPGGPGDAGAEDAARLDAALADVPEVGAPERDALLAHFGGYRWVRVATPDALAQVPGIDAATAARIHERLRV